MKCSNCGNKATCFIETKPVCRLCYMKLKYKDKPFTLVNRLKIMKKKELYN